MQKIGSELLTNCEKLRSRKYPSSYIRTVSIAATAAAAIYIYLHLVHDGTLLFQGYYLEARTALSSHSSLCFNGVKRGGNGSIWVTWFVGRACKTNYSLQGVKTQKRSPSANLPASLPGFLTMPATKCRRICANLFRRCPPLNWKCSSWLEFLFLLNLGSLCRLRRYVVCSAPNAPISIAHFSVCDAKKLLRR